jgi:hypothetical protein
MLTQRIAGSVLFQRSPRLKALLLYVAERALTRPGEALNEHQIGCAVFERPADYSPGEDNIVRVQARHLRARLEEYFQNEGREEGLILEIPKGGYLPVFRVRDEAAVAPAGKADARKVSWSWYALGLLAAAVAGWFVHEAMPARTRSEEASWILAALFEKQEPVRLVIPDSSFGLLQGFLKKNLSLSDYLKPGYPKEIIEASTSDVEVRARAGAAASRPYTTFSDALIVSRATALAGKQGWKLNFAFPRQMTPRDFEQGNYILVGSSKSNPWSGLYEAGMNFQSFYDLGASRGGIRNLKPREGEAVEYLTESRHGYSGEAYALVGLHVGKRGRVLTLAGTNMEGTEAAWDFVASPERAAELKRRVDWETPEDREAHLEVVLRTYVLGDAARDTSVVAVRRR